MPEAGEHKSQPERESEKKYSLKELFAIDEPVVIAHGDLDMIKERMRHYAENPPDPTADPQDIALYNQMIEFHNKVFFNEKEELLSTEEQNNILRNFMLTGGVRVLEEPEASEELSKKERELLQLLTQEEIESIIGVLKDYKKDPEKISANAVRKILLDARYIYIEKEKPYFLEAKKNKKIPEKASHMRHYGDFLPNETDRKNFKTILNVLAKVGLDEAGNRLDKLEGIDMADKDPKEEKSQRLQQFDENIQKAFVDRVQKEIEKQLGEDLKKPEFLALEEKLNLLREQLKKIPKENQEEKNKILAQIKQESDKYYHNIKKEKPADNAQKSMAQPEGAAQEQKVDYRKRYDDFRANLDNLPEKDREKFKEDHGESLKQLLTTRGKLRKKAEDSIALDELTEIDKLIVSLNAKVEKIKQALAAQRPEASQPQGASRSEQDILKEDKLASELRNEINKIDEYIKGLRKIYGAKSDREDMLLTRKKELEEKLQKITQSTPQPEGGALLGATQKMTPEQLRQQNEERERAMQQATALSGEALDKAKALQNKIAGAKPQPQAKIDTKVDLPSGTDTQKDIPVAREIFGGGEMGDLDEFNKESIRLEKERAEIPVAKIAPPLSKAETFEKKKDELKQIITQGRMLEGFGDGGLGPELVEKMEEVFAEVGELTDEDLKRRVQVETKKMLGKKEMNPEKFRKREMPKIIREIEAEQKVKAEEVCRKDGEGKRLYDLDQKDNPPGTRFDFYVNKKIEASGLEPQEFYAMAGRGVRVDQLKEKVAFWKSAWNFIRGKEVITNKYEIPTDAGETMYLSEDQLEAFLFDQKKQTEREIEKRKEEKFAQKLQKGRAKLAETRAKVAEGILEKAEVKYYNVRGEEVGVLAKNMDARTFTEKIVIPKSQKDKKEDVAERTTQEPVKKPEVKPEASKLIEEDEAVRRLKEDLKALDEAEAKKIKQEARQEPKVEPVVEKSKPLPEIKATLDERIKDIFGNNPKIEGVFDPDQMWENLKEYSSKENAPKGMSKEEIKERNNQRKAILSEFKENLLRQQEALADCYGVIQEEIENNPNIARQKLMDIVETFSENYGFTDKQKYNAEKLINEYFELRERAIDLMADYRHDDKGLIEKLTGKTLTEDDMKGIYKISLGTVAIIIEASDEMTQKLRSKKSKQGAKWLGFHNAGSWLEQSPHYVVINRELITKLQGAAGIEKVLAHELQHAENDIIEEVLQKQEEEVYYTDYRDEKDPEKKQQKLGQYLRQVQREALNDVRDEIITSLHTVGTDKVKLEELFIAKEKGWLKGMIETVTFSGEKVQYDFLKEARNKKLYYKDKGLSKKLFDQQYKRVIKDALSAFSDLVDPGKGGYEPQKAVSLLMGKELYFWPTNVKRLLNKKQEKK